MIDFEEKLNDVNSEISLAIKKLWRNVSPHTIQILAGKSTEEQVKHLVLQGGKLDEVNQARALANLFPLDAKSNRKIAKPKFADYLKKGEGAFETASSRSGKPVIAYGGARVSTTQQKFGTGSAIFDGTGDYLSTPQNADFDF